MLETLIPSKTRIKLLMRLFLNPGITAHLRGMAEEFGESTNSIRLELNRFEEAGMLLSDSEKNKKLYRVNKQHPLFLDIHNILLKYIGIDTLIDTIIPKLGNLTAVYMTGDYAKGKDSGVIDLMFIGNDINKQYLGDLVNRAEKLIGKKIKFLHYEQKEWDNLINGEIKLDGYLLLWER